MKNQKGFAHILGLLLLVAGLGASVYLVGQKTNLFPRAASAPIGCQSDSNCPSGYKCQIQATTLRECPSGVSAPACNTMVGKCVPIPTGKSQPSSSPNEPSMRTSSLRPYSTFTRSGSGIVNISLTNTYSSGFIDVTLFGNLYNLMPNRVYEVWLCHTPSGSCGTNSNPKIMTDSRGNASFSGISFSHNQKMYPIDSVRVYEKVESSPLPTDPTVCVKTTTSSQPCLSGSVYPSFSVSTSMSIPTPVVCSACSADLNGDSYVNMADFGKLIGCMNKKSTDSAWNTCQSVDLNGDGQVNINDFSCIRSQYGKQCLVSKH